jgi:hypothetical protein
MRFCARKLIIFRTSSHFQQQHRTDRLLKRHAKQRGIQQHYMYKTLQACISVCARIDYQLLAKTHIQKSKNTRRDYLARLAFDARFPTLTRQTIFFKERVKLVKQYIYDRTLCVGFVKFKLMIIEMKKWRIVVAKALQLRRRLYYSHMFRAWHLFKVNSKNMGALYYKRYLQKLCKKVMFALHMNVAMSKEYLRTIELEVQHRTKDAAAFKMFVFRIVKLQAVARRVSNFFKIYFKCIYSV